MNDQVTKEETTKILEIAGSCTSLDGDFVELGCYRGDTSVLLGKLLASCGKLVEKSNKSVDNNTKNVQNHHNSVQNSVENPVENSQQSTPHSAQQPTPYSSSYTPVKRLFIYDSFAGLPEKSPQDISGAGANFRAGSLIVTKREVIAKLKKHRLDNVVVKKAWFSDLTPEDLPEKIAFAFIDGDFYESQRGGLRLVAPRLTPGATIICHDYNNPELPGASKAVDEFLVSHPSFRLSTFHSLAILTQKP